MRTTHRKLLTTPKVPKKKKQKDEWNKSVDISDDEDSALQPRSILDDRKRLQAAITSAMKSNLRD
uniref:Ribosome biogenesis protein NOP53 n=1 Tax=Romanomermis culicivorax TaxID=13658 RepID=A0A915KR08_ROMCU